MRVQKVTVGYVVQIYDTELGRYISQEFVAGDEVTTEDMLGNPVDEDEIPDYLPFDMMQPG